MWLVIEFCRFSGKKTPVMGFSALEDAVNFVMFGYSPLDWAVLDITIQEVELI